MSSSNSYSDESIETSWVSWFCNLPRNHYLCQVDEEYINDRFNLTGLNDFISDFDKCYRTVKGYISDENSNDSDCTIFDADAELLYGLIHARFILTQRGLEKMLDKYKTKQFGTCPRVYCKNTPVLPTGLSSMPLNSSVLLYCPSCCDVYRPPIEDYMDPDGCFFGYSFPTMFFLAYKNLIPTFRRIKNVPRLFGFKVNKYALNINYDTPPIEVKYEIDGSETTSEDLEEVVDQQH